MSDATEAPLAPHRFPPGTSAYSLFYSLGQLPDPRERNIQSAYLHGHTWRSFVVVAAGAGKRIAWMDLERRIDDPGPTSAKTYRAARWVITTAPFELIPIKPITP